MPIGPLKGKVVKILSNYSVAINLGRLMGVTEGMRFIIYEEGEIIKDPDTHADIEKLELVKGTVKVTQVQERISVAESYETVKRTIRPFGALLDNIPMEKEIEVTEKKKLIEDKITAIVPSKVKVGDLVRQI